MGLAFTGTTRRIVDIVRQATCWRRRSPQRGIAKLFQGTSIVAAAQRIVQRTTSFNDELDEIIELARELPLLDSSEAGDAKLAPTQDVIQKLRDIGAEIDAYDKVCAAALPAPTPFFDPRPQKPNKTLLNETQRRARGINKSLRALNLQLRSQDPLL